MEPTRVLVVDDERVSRMALCELLRDEGYEVAAAGDGIEALERIATFHPQVVLSDVKMPRMNGIQLRDALAGQAHAPVVVLMSVYPLPDDSGLFIGKPIDLHELSKAVAAASAECQRFVRRVAAMHE
jgi:CheY-like chemotaxis protein